MLEETTSVRVRVETRLENGVRIDPTFLGIDADVVPPDFYKVWNMTIDGVVDLRKCVSQAHSGLCIGRPLPHQFYKAASGNRLALREAYEG